jgi:predicted N-formylglutamate amidohydrolase
MPQTAPTQKSESVRLLQPGDPPPFEIVNKDGAGRVILIADHAGRAFPRSLGTLGLSQAELARHIAWDIGIGEVTRWLSRDLDAPALLGSYSRLVIDCNRRLDNPTSIPQESDGTNVPGNRGLSPADRRRRAVEIHAPYHAAIAHMIASRQRSGISPALVSMHSFTPVMNGFERPWHVGILWKDDPRIPVPLMARLRREDGLCVGDNQPYSGRDEQGYSIFVHGEEIGIPYGLVEIRQDLIDTPAGVLAWADRMAAVLKDVLADERIFAPRKA